MGDIHRTAAFTLPRPTRKARAVLERAFRDYTHAYSRLLYTAWLRFGQSDDLVGGQTSGLDALRGLATLAVDARTGTPRLSARKLTHALFAGDQLPARAREALDRLPNRLRQSAREHAGQSLLSYVAMADAWLQENPTQRGGVPQFPQRPRPGKIDAVDATRSETLDALALLANDHRAERTLVARLLKTRDRHMSAIPFVGVADEYGCALYYCPETASYYARLDIGAPHAHGAAPLSMHGVYIQIKSGERWASATHLQALATQGVATTGIRSFGRRTGCLWLPLKLDEVAGNPTKRASYHVRPLRFTRAAYLPYAARSVRSGSAVVAGADGAPPAVLPVTPPSPISAANPSTGSPDAVGSPISDEASGARVGGHSDEAPGETLAGGAVTVLAAEPVTAKLVRHQTEGKIWYQLHVTFALPVAALDADDDQAREERPILGINRGLHHLYVAALISADGQREVATFAASGETLLARQAALEAYRRLQQRRGVQPRTRRARRQRMLAAHEIHVCANQITEIARRARAQVVFEDLSAFASGAGLRAITDKTHPPRARAVSLRTLLNRRQFEALRKAVDQRLALVGLLPARVVPATAISQTCVTCGSRDPRSYQERQEAATSAGRDFDPRQFICPTCGAERDVDTVAAINVARKCVWLQRRGAEKRTGIEDDARTPWERFARQVATATAHSVD